MIYLSRKVYFSAAHLYRKADWSEEENKRVFGLCSNPNGHGHDYVLEVMARGHINEQSGIVVNTTEIDRVVKGLIQEEFNGKFLNHEHPYFQERVPTTENLVAELDETVNQIVIEKFDHKHLNLDTEEFKNMNPTSDNMVKVIWEMFSPYLSGLYKIGLWETEKNYFEYYGPNQAI
ncbi:6-carboxytetrahydropterin synthase [Bacillus songklensis]|uniref:6-carboxy-5,6,7,8-tetrahydropterin synthase n=1 Tax=Bacillus songklensis TaxID=1069116 RepID=A0ABV8B3N0_9BACI